MPRDFVVPEATDEELAVVEQLGVSRESWKRVESFVAFLCDVQRHTNLISNGSIPHLWTRHVIDSLQLMPHIPAGTTCMADLGSGSGFPAIPLAIVTGAKVHAYESIGKKANFLREAAKATGCQVEVHHQRLETLTQMQNVPKVEVVTARALAALPALLILAEPFLKTGAKALFHKGRECDAELTEASKYWKIKAERHSSLTDSSGIILDVSEAYRV